MADDKVTPDAILDKMFEGDKENANLFLQKVKLHITGILYDSNEQAKDPDTFHKAIDGHSNTLTLLRHGIRIVGGVLFSEWHSSILGTSISDANAYLFSLTPKFDIFPIPADMAHCAAKGVSSCGTVFGVDTDGLWELCTTFETTSETGIKAKVNPNGVFQIPNKNFLFHHSDRVWHDISRIVVATFDESI